MHRLFCFLLHLIFLQQKWQICAKASSKHSFNMTCPYKFFQLVPHMRQEIHSLHAQISSKIYFGGVWRCYFAWTQSFGGKRSACHCMRDFLVFAFNIPISQWAMKNIYRMCITLDIFMEYIFWSNFGWMRFSLDQLSFVDCPKEFALKDLI